MVLTLLGFVVAQLVWIKKSYSVAEQDFNNKTKNALNDVVEHLKSKDIFLLLNKQNQPNSVITYHNMRDALILNNQALVNQLDSMPLDSIELWSSKSQLITRNVTNDSSEIAITIVNHEVNNGKESFINIDTLIQGNNTTQITINNTSEGNNSVTVNSSIQDMIQEIVIQYSSEADPLESRLANVNLDSLIRAKLNNRGINLPFGYGIKRETGDSLISKYSSEEKIPSNQITHTINLFENDVFDLNNELIVWFNNPSTYLFRQLRWMLFSLFALTLMMLFTFGYTLNIIWKQKKMDEMKNDFINNMTHEFKTPVATINLAVDALTHPKNKSDWGQVTHYSQLIREENNRINQQVERVLNITRFSQPEFPLEKEKTNIRQSIDQAIATLELQIKNRQAQVETTFCDPSITWNVDPNLTHKLWVNLIDNALKYCDKQPVIEFSCHVHNEQLIVEINDNGIGMSKETQERIFENFYREQGGNIHTVKGFGLGMSYVKKIMDLHQGTIQIKSQKNHGTRIHLIFPK